MNIINFRQLWQLIPRLIRRVTRWDRFQIVSQTAVVLAIGTFLSWFYLENLRDHQESLSTTLLILSLMLSGVIVALVAVKRKWGGLGWIVGIYLVLAIGFLLSWLYWDDLRDDQDSLSTTVRNVGLVIGGIVAIILAVWRSIVAEHQSHTGQRGLLNERYQKGAEMLGSEVMAVRLGGIYALERLAAEHPDIYHIQIMKLFCSYVRNPTKAPRIEYDPESDGDQDEQVRSNRADVEGVMIAIGSRSLAGISLEHGSAGFKLYLRDANLANLQVQCAMLSGAWLTNANLSGAKLPHADLSSARLRIANMSDAKFRNADLSKAILRGANLSGADLCDADVHSPDNKAPVRGLTQAQLDEACADPDNPPKLDGALDAETGMPLVWRGKPCRG